MLREKEPNGALEQALGRLYQSEDVPAGFETGWRAAVKREESRMKLVENSTRRPFWRAIVPAFAALVLGHGGGRRAEAGAHGQPDAAYHRL